MRDIALLIIACKDLMGISTPIQVEYRLQFKGKCRNMSAYCLETLRKGKLVKFRVVINCKSMVESEYDSYSVIAHEIVHAKMIEDGTFNTKFHHDKRFQDICKELEKQLKKIGFPVITPLYSPATDTD